MTHDELIDHIASCAGISKAQAKRALECMQGGIIKGLEATGTLRLQIGSFVLRDRAERQGRNPQTGAPITISARKVVAFKPSKMLKEIINKESHQSQSSF